MNIVLCDMLQLRQKWEFYSVLKKKMYIYISTYEPEAPFTRVMYNFVNWNVMFALNSTSSHLQERAKLYTVLMKSPFAPSVKWKYVVWMQLSLSLCCRSFMRGATLPYTESILTPVGLKYRSLQSDMEDQMTFGHGCMLFKRFGLDDERCAPDSVTRSYSQS